MARRFNGAGDSVDLGTAIRGTDLVGIMLAAWIKPEISGGAGAILARWDAGSTDQYLFSLNGGKVFLAVLDSSFTGHSASGATTLPLNTWSHVAALFISGGITVYLNGAADGSASCPNLNHSLGTTHTYIGRTASSGNYFTGAIAETTIMLANPAVNPGTQMANVAAALAAGESPSVVEAMFDTDHIGYWPLLGETPEPNYTGAAGSGPGTVTGTTMIAHPGVRTVTAFKEAA